MGKAYLVLLDTAQSENTKWSDFIPVLCFSIGKLYFLCTCCRVYNVNPQMKTAKKYTRQKIFSTMPTLSCL